MIRRQNDKKTNDEKTNDEKTKYKMVVIKKCGSRH